MNDAVTIEHDTHGRVEGVKREGIAGCVWEKDGALYFDARGWREVSKPKWVPVQLWVCGGCLGVEGTFFHLPPGYRWKKVVIEQEVEE